MILGISGLAGSGKDQFATYLGPVGAVTVALADPLKRIARDVYAFTDEQLWGPSAERNKPDERYPREHSWHASTCTCCGQSRFATTNEVVPPCFLTPRFALQTLGTEWGRTCFPDTWAALCVRTAKMLLDDPAIRYNQRTGLVRLGAAPRFDRTKIVSVSDVRFKNEMRVIREAGGKVVRIKRPGAGLKGSAGLHPSEAEQASIPDAEFDFVVENTGTLADLQAAAEDLGQRLAK